MKIPGIPGPLNPFRTLAATHFGRKIGSGFGVTVLLAILITVVSIYALRSVISTNDLVAFNHAQDLFDAEKLRTVANQKVAIARGFLLTRDGLFVEDARMADLELRSILKRLQARATTASDRQQLAKLVEVESVHEVSLKRAYAFGKRKTLNQSRMGRFFNEDVMPKFDAWERALSHYAKSKELQMEKARNNAHDAASRALRLIVVIAAGALGLAVTLAFVLTRTLTRVYEKLAIAVRAREDVLAIVSHDLKNPLSSILLSSALMVRAQEMPDEQRIRSARTIHTSGQQMKKLIEDLLDFVKVESGRMNVQKRLEASETLIEDVMAVFTPLAREKGVDLQSSVASEVGAIDCERSRILQVLSNLLGNAIKFTPSGGQVSIHIATMGDQTLFWVKDTGPGIPTEQLSRVFDRYWQGDQDERQGVGLGLAIAKGLVEAHGGRIWAESRPGQGSTFFFTLPNPTFKSEIDNHFVVEGLRGARRLGELMINRSGKSRSAEKRS